jgi:hypothetical protein
MQPFPSTMELEKKSLLVDIITNRLDAIFFFETFSMG